MVLSFLVAKTKKISYILLIIGGKSASRLLSSRKDKKYHDRMVSKKFPTWTSDKEQWATVWLISYKIKVS